MLEAKEQTLEICYQFGSTGRIDYFHHKTGMKIETKEILEKRIPAKELISFIKNANSRHSLLKNITTRDC